MARSRRSRTSASSSISWCRWRSRSLPPLGGAVRKFLSVGKLRERFAKRDEFARRRKAERDAAGEAFEIEDAAKLFADFAADDGLLDELRDGAEARFDGFAVDQRAQNPGAQQTRAHAGDGDVEGGEQRGRAAAAGFLVEDGIDEFEIADGDGIEDERVVLLVVADAIEVAQGFDARGFVERRRVRERRLRREAEERWRRRRRRERSRIRGRAERSPRAAFSRR